MTMLVPFAACGRECAEQMLSNAMYVQQELPKVRMSDALRAQTQDICGTLIGTKHDLITELLEIDELVAGDATDEEIAARVERMVEWTFADLKALHEVVLALDEDGRRDPEMELAVTLVMESATNVVNAFQDMRGAAEGLLRALHGSALQGGVPT
jgi:hypothetical protein